MSSEAGSSRQSRRVAQRRRSRARTGLIAGVAALALAGVAVVGVWVRSGPTRVAHHRAAPTTTTTPAKTPPPAVTATSKVPELVAYESPAPNAPQVTKLSSQTEYGFYRTMLVTDQSTHPGWLQVLLPIRPNGATGWIQAGDVVMGSTDYALRVELGAHKLTLYKAGEPVLSSGTVNGKSETPTPVGTFYVTDPVDLQKNPNGAYGAFAIGVSAYSDVIKEFKGGPGQIAVHGTSHPDQIGQDISNGCVRVPNDVILEIAKRVPLGTPVIIVA